MGIRRHTHPGAGRPVEHPGWNLQPTVRIGTAQATAKNRAVRSLDRRVNADPKTEPRMPRVQQFSKLSSVGVLKLCCITDDDRIRALTAPHPVKPTSPRCPSAWQPNPGRGSTYQCGKSVQTTGTTSKCNEGKSAKLQLFHFIGDSPGGGTLSCIQGTSPGGGAARGQESALNSSRACANAAMSPGVT